MKQNKIFLFCVFLFCVLQTQNSEAQYASKKIKTKHEVYTDSLKNVEYNYIFPILGQGAYKKGFDIPYPAGAMVNFIWLDQNIVIDNMQLGLKTDNIDIPLTGVDFIQFGENKNTSYAVNFRPDLWILPFLNVYGLFGYGSSTTEVNLVAPIGLQSIVEQEMTTKGVGVMGAGGIGPVWFSVDANWTWNKPELLDEPVKVNVLGLRIGQTFTFKEKPDRNFAVWVGGMRTKMNTATSGQIRISDVIPGFDQSTDEIVVKYEAWKADNYDDLTFKQKAVVNNVLDPLVQKIGEKDGSAIIRYGMDKQVAQLWNGIVGAQFQLNKRWMIRSEAGVIGDRKSFLASLNYRFLF